jgi:putative zinc finger protein
MIEAPGVHSRELLSAYLDGELSESDRAFVEEHLCECPACRTLLEDFRAVAAAAAREQAPPFPADLPARIRGAIASREREGETRRGRGLWSYRLAWAAAAGVVVVTGLYAIRQGMAPAGSPRSVPSIAPEFTSSKDDARSEIAPRKEARPSSAIAREPSEVPSRPLPPQAAVRGQAKTALSAQPAAGGTLARRVLLFDYPSHRISVFEDGTIAVSAEGYACSARADAPSVDPDLASLFALASSATGQPAATQGSVVKDAPSVRLADAPVAAEGLDVKSTPAADLPAEKRTELEVRLRTLMRDRYLALLEERCGPAPRSLRSP